MGRVVEGADVGEADFATEQIAEMDVDLGRSVDGDVHVPIADHIAGNEGAAKGRAATTAVEVDPHSAGSGSLGLVGEISGTEVADDPVSIHGIRGESKIRLHMRVSCDTAKPVTFWRVVDDHVLRSATEETAKKRWAEIHSGPGRSPFAWTRRI